MIKKLRRKFIATILCMLSTILIIVLTLFLTFTKRSTVSQSLEALEYYAGRPSSEIVTDKTNSLFGSRSSEYSNYNIFILEYNTALNQIKVYGTDDDISDERKEYLISLFDATMEKSDGVGIVEQFNMRYRRTYQLAKIKIVYLDKTYEDYLIHDFTVRTAVIGVIGWLAFFGITIIIAHIALKPVERSWEQQQRLVADVSHELKTPVAVIRSNVDIISQSPDSTVASQGKWLGYIEAETERLSTLITNMLYLAKTEDERSKSAAFCLIDFSELCEETVLPFESICFEKGLSLEYTIQPGIFINGNADLLKQLVVIFMDNACKYSDPNKPIVFSLSEKQEHAVMSVTDYGKVILPEEAKHIFERFYRADAARSHSGYGLGLSIAKTIIDAHGAKVSLASGNESGTVFTCTFKQIKK